MEKRIAVDIFAKMTKEQLYDDNQGLYKELDKSYNKLKIQDSVIIKLKDENKNLRKELDTQKEKNTELLEQIDVFKSIVEDNKPIDVKNTEEYKSILNTNSIYFNKIKELEKELSKITAIKSEINDSIIFDKFKIQNEANTKYNKPIPAYKLMKEDNLTFEKNILYKCKNQNCDEDEVEKNDDYCIYCKRKLKYCKKCNIDFVNDELDVKYCEDCTYDLELEGVYQDDESIISKNSSIVEYSSECNAKNNESQNTEPKKK